MSFPFFERAQHLESAFVKTLPADIREGIAGQGIRNSHLTAITPTGTISLLANNVSSGIEPMFGLSYRRPVLSENGIPVEYDVVDYAYHWWRKTHGDSQPPPADFVLATELAPQLQLNMQAELQRYVDSAISKTVQVPEDYPFAEFERLYELAYTKGLKRCTTFRPNAITGELVDVAIPAAEGSHCCHVDREAD